jgi:hypothetical protein
MMTEASVTEHDPLCPMIQPCVDKDSGHINDGHAICDCHTICMHCEMACQCELLSRVRADEREQAKRRVLGLAKFTEHIRQLRPEALVHVCANVASYDRIEPQDDSAT